MHTEELRTITLKLFPELSPPVLHIVELESDVSYTPGTGTDHTKTHNEQNRY